MQVTRAWAFDIEGRIESELQDVLAHLTRFPCPPRLAEALRYAVIPGGGRIRPQLCLSVAKACGDRDRRLSSAAAAAIELLHCASLVHDDLPCFDDATTRRGRPALHRVFGEALAVLAGDGMIVAAFDLLCRVGTADPEAKAGIQNRLLHAVGVPSGLVAGQGWEGEDAVDLELYHACKTRPLFEAAAVSGALAAGAVPEPWCALGQTLGEAYQLADDIVDVVGSKERHGKPVARDQALGRPNVALERGLEPAAGALRRLLRRAGDQVPECPGREPLRRWLCEATMRLLSRALENTPSGGLAQTLVTP